MPLSKIQFGNTGRRNLVMNGGMLVAQRGTTSTAVGADGVSGYHNMDRWRIGIGATSAGRVTMAQTAVTDLASFSKSMKISCTTADTSVAAGEALIFSQRFEGQNLQSLKASSTSTQAFTVSFYAKSNASRAIATEINFVNGTNRSASKLHTIGTSWARYTMTIPAASSTQIDDDNSHEMDLNFWLHAGSTYTSGTMSGTLGAITNANRAAGIGSIFASTSNTLEITGVQIEKGSVATDFEHFPFSEEIEKCKRYYQHIGYQYGDTIGGTNTFNGAIPGFKMGGTSAYYGGEMFPVEMRAIPTLTIYAVVSGTETAGKLIDFNSGADLGSASVARLRANGYNYLSSGSNSAGAVYRSVLDAEL